MKVGQCRQVPKYRLRCHVLVVFSVKKMASLLCKLFYMTCVVDSILLLLLLHFTLTVEVSLKIRKRLTLKKVLPLPAPFQPFRFRVRFRFQPLSSKCFRFRFHKKFNRFHIPEFNIRVCRLLVSY